MHIVDIHIVATVIIETEYVDITDCLTHNHTVRLIIINEPVGILEFLSLLETEFGRKALHLFAEISEQFLRFTTQNLTDTRNISVICLFINSSGTATLAFFDMVLQTEPSIAFGYIFGS